MSYVPAMTYARFVSARHGTRISLSASSPDGSLEAIQVTDLVELMEFQSLAGARMPEAVRFISQCAAPGWGNALRANERAWQRWALRPRILSNVGTRDTSTTVLGQHVQLPVLIAPFSCSALCNPD